VGGGGAGARAGMQGGGGPGEGTGGGQGRCVRSCVYLYVVSSAFGGLCVGVWACVCVGVGVGVFNMSIRGGGIGFVGVVIPLWLHV
jgi:hypothetical protein